MSIVDRIIMQLDELNLSQKDLTDYLGIDKSTFSQWKKGKSQSYKKYIEKIADFLDVSTDYLLIDERFQFAIKKYGFFWEPRKREKEKAEARNALEKGGLSNKEIVDKYIIIFKALFSRSIEAYSFKLDHPDLNVYIAMLLNQNQWRKQCTKSGVYSDMVEQYGKREGIPEGSYFTGWNAAPDAMNARPLPQVYNCKYYHSVSAGIGTFADEDCDTYSYFFSSQAQADHCFAVDIEGDSMLPELRSGDVAIVDTEKELSNGDVVVFVDKSEDLGYIKQYHKTDNEIMFISYNSAYKPMIFPLSALNDRIKICGKVIKSLRDF